ncbi:MAG: hypothetical protein AAGD07_16110 [Planctomycetota bacterium]
MDIQSLDPVTVAIVVVVGLAAYRFIQRRGSHGKRPTKGLNLSGAAHDTTPQATKWQKDLVAEMLDEQAEQEAREEVSRKLSKIVGDQPAEQTTDEPPAREPAANERDRRQPAK